MREVYVDEFEESIAAWEEVRGDSGIWGRYKEFQSRGLKWFLESSLREAVGRKLGVRSYERSDGRRGNRNRSYVRTVGTPYGTGDVGVPRPPDLNI